MIARVKREEYIAKLKHTLQMFLRHKENQFEQQKNMEIRNILSENTQTTISYISFTLLNAFFFTRVDYLLNKIKNQCNASKSVANEFVNEPNRNNNIFRSKNGGKRFRLLRKA